MLRVIRIGSARDRRSPLVLVHGFTQNARCWPGFGEALAAAGPLVAIDAPGHGDSGHDAVGLQDAGRLLVEAGGNGHYLGYSMGGRMLLHAALETDADSMHSLVLIGATGGIDDPVERQARVASDGQLADEIIGVGTEAFVDRWLAGPLFARLSTTQAARDERLRNRSEGLAESLRHCGTGTQEPLWDRLAAIAIPVLVIAGRDDPKFTELGERLVEAIGNNARFETVEGGHAVHLENPAGTAGVVNAWLDQVDAGQPGTPSSSWTPALFNKPETNR